MIIKGRSTGLAVKSETLSLAYERKTGGPDLPLAIFSGWICAEPIDFQGDFDSRNSLSGRGNRVRDFSVSARSCFCHSTPR